MANIFHIDRKDDTITIGGSNTAITCSRLTKVGDSTNYASFASDGELTLAGTARVNSHFIIGAASFYKKTSPPEDAIIGIYPVLKFDPNTDEQCYYSEVVPCRLAAGTTISVTVDWCYEGGEDSGTVVWGIEFLNLNTGETVAGTTTTITGKSAASQASGKLIQTTIDTGITGSVAKDILGLRLFRDADDAVNDTLLVDACLIQIHLCFVMDKLGEAT